MTEISKGSRGQAVKDAQRLLTEKGHPCTIDGIYGSGTAACVSAFQKSKGLPETGVVDAKTWSLLLEPSVADHLYECLLLDYGHGGLIDGVYQTPGGKQYTHTSVSPHLVLYEGVSNRMSAAALARKAIAAGVRVIDVVADKELTKDVTWKSLEQHDISLGKRVRNANQYPKGLMISCHSNAVGNTIKGPSQRANGIDIYTSRGQTKSDPIATDIYNGFKSTMKGLRVRGGQMEDGDPDYEADFYVIRKTSMPAVLGEIGFFTNLSDAQFLHDEENHEIIAECYWIGVKKHLKAD